MLKVLPRNSGTAVIFYLQGQIVNGETDILKNAVAFQPNVSAVILDLAGVNLVDAAGLGVMLELREQAKSRGIRFELMNLNKWVRYVLELSRLDSVFEMRSEVECLPTVARNHGAPTRLLASYT
ncbi:MAG TPA: STAS domain-containing protein [Pyrinomonadaceae bacterium]|nr:STAS domain-containing protein [Pyrinomonadaceae bacterium]